MAKPKYTEPAVREIYHMGLKDGFTLAINDLLEP